jgi:sigma-B regulation protein RsbU (phosphoserine phosphatase)
MAQVSRGSADPATRSAPPAPGLPVPGHDGAHLDRELSSPVRARRGRRWDARFRPTLPHGVEAALSLAILAGLAVLDYHLGPHVDLAVFYFLPICIAAWSHGLWFGLLVAAVAVAASHERIPSVGETPAYILFQDVAHILMYLPAAWLTWLVKRQGDRLADENGKVLEAQSRIQADLEAAQRVQRSLMGQALPEVPQLAMAMGYRAARQVGGDLIDVRRRGVRLGFCVADVSGKGAQAALMAVAVKGWLDYVPGRFVSPQEVAEQLNRRLCDCVPTEMFVTLAYLVVNTSTGEARCAIAGHEPPLIYRAPTGVVERMGPTGPALGLIPDVRYGEVNLTLNPGDLLLLYTDGLTTARRSSGGRTGLAPATALLRDFDGANLNALVQQLLETTVPPAGDPDDDVAILVVQRLPPGERMTG